MEVHAEQLSVKNDDDEVFMYEHYSRANVKLHQVKMVLRTVETNHEVPLTIQFQEVISPVNIYVRVLCCADCSILD